ncbi:hypothetical protein F2Q68_00004756 [Brassica cretica]|uniref:Uncharacterized protein n=1 Tax=Brassica cretica TaxID=69181 RepID=A0A8S9JKI6_BRACR|nr:hypothetical protein F2Q68_00004756 [Brassica cretica]
MTLLVQYLEANILPEDHNEAGKIKKPAARGIRAGSGLPGPLILANPHKSGTTIVARPQRIKMGMRHKAGMGSNLNPASSDVAGTEIHTVDFRLNKESRRTLVSLSDRTVYVLGRYVATKLGCSSVASFGCTRSLRSDRALARARSLRSDRARLELGCYIATELGLCVVRWP